MNYCGTLEGPKMRLVLFRLDVLSFHNERLYNRSEKLNDTRIFHCQAYVYPTERSGSQISVVPQELVYHWGQNMAGISTTIQLPKH